MYIVDISFIKQLRTSTFLKILLAQYGAEYLNGKDMVITFNALVDLYSLYVLNAGNLQLNRVINYLCSLFHSSVPIFSWWLLQLEWQSSCKDRANPFTSTNSTTEVSSQNLRGGAAITH